MGPPAAAGARQRQIISRERLWELNDLLKPVRDGLEDEVVRLGWFTRRPSTLITRWSFIGIGEMLLGGALRRSAAS